jgi:cytochrome c peroxidase
MTGFFRALASKEAIQAPDVVLVASCFGTIEYWATERRHVQAAICRLIAVQTDAHSHPTRGAWGRKRVWDGTQKDDTQKDEDKYLFRVSMLRNIAKTGPYFHAGAVVQLSNAVNVLADVRLDVPPSRKDTNDIVPFLDSLTGTVPTHFSTPVAKNVPSCPTDD